MATDVTMPRLSDSMEEGTVLKWLVEEGGEVKRGEPLVEIETDKANMTYEADTDGVLIEVLAKEGDTLAIGEVIARIGEAGEAKGGGEAKEEEPEPEPEEEPPAEDPEAEADDAEADKADAQAEAADADEADDAGAEQTERQPAAAQAQGEAGAADGGGTAVKERASSGNGGRVKASPVARRMARELGVELARLEGSGPGGRIVKADVQAAAESGAPAPDDGAERGEAAQAAPAKEPEGAPEPQRGEAGAKGEAEIQELTRLQQTVSRRMAESKATAPDFAISLTVDMTLAVELRARL